MALNVLVVDDSAVMRSIVIRTLKLSGIELNEICQAGNGQQALDLLEKHWIDLVLVDINMPVMNGIEMINHVRQKADLSELPIIVVSTESSETRIEMLKEKNIVFVHKPFSAETLREAVFKLTGVIANATPSKQTL